MTTPLPDKETAIKNLADQIIGQGTMGKWSTGAGLTKESAAKMMAEKMYNQAGITDVNQFGKVPVYEKAIPIAWTFNGKPVINNPGHGMTVGTGQMINEGWDSEAGAYSMREARRNLTPEEQKQLTVTHYGFNGVDADGMSGVVGYYPAADIKNIKGDLVLDTGQTAYGNKATGQAIPVEYDRAHPNDWGGTFAGDSSSGFGVQFDAQGKPYFYTHYDTTDPFGGLAPALGIAASVFGGPMGAAAFQALNTIANGGDLGDILESGAKAYLGGQLGGELTSGLTDSIGATAANIAGNVVKSEIASGGKLDPVQALISSGIGAGTSAVLGEIPGFDSFDPKTQAAISKVVGSTLATGNLSPTALVQAAISAGTSAAANATNTPTESQFTDDNQAFVDSLAPYLSTDTPTSNAADANTADNQDFIDLLAPHQSTDITDLIATDFPADTKGNWDEVTGKFVPDENGGTTYGQINPATSGNVENMKDWVFDKESGKWAWTDPETGETTNYDYATPITGGPVQTGKDIEDKAGAGVDGNATPVAPVKIPAAKIPAAKVPAAKAPAATTPAPTDTTKKPAVNTTDLAALLATLSGGQQAPQYMPGVGDVAHIKSSNLFGPLLGSEEPAPSATKSQSDSVDQLLAEDEQYASGGHVDNLNVDALLHILRS